MFWWLKKPRPRIPLLAPPKLKTDYFMQQQSSSSFIRPDMINLKAGKGAPSARFDPASALS
jgi:hypothetical protein